MATWGLHIRIAEALLDKAQLGLDRTSFLVGNIATDAGKPNADWSAFTPPPEISHFKDEKKRIRPDFFYKTYLSNPKDGIEEWSFLLGYYVHLITDVKWNDFFERMKEINPLYKKVETDKDFIWVIKKDWYDLDHLYFRQNRNSMFWTTFQHIKDFPDYLDYFEKGQVNEKIEYIRDFYTSSKDNLDREYKYLQPHEMKVFEDDTVAEILRIFDEIF